MKDKEAGANTSLSCFPLGLMLTYLSLSTVCSLYPDCRTALRRCAAATDGQWLRCFNLYLVLMA
ncbi:hypothetical protein [Catalinimonas niigatensis]|uniref:hypothetical protein n=1 Tax=Catalinimonas niigatensis TaxID=1397264 RepID=UPI002666A6A0|nr:hypothetical protein [Catalinimonas niigatensis]WPP52359.1 hypothetical protein PZB72_08190 [Catalinimonas niigatensis]